MARWCCLLVTWLAGGMEILAILSLDSMILIIQRMVGSAATLGRQGVLLSQLSQQHPPTASYGWRQGIRSRDFSFKGAIMVIINTDGENIKEKMVKISQRLCLYHKVTEVFHDMIKCKSWPNISAKRCSYFLCWNYLFRPITMLKTSGSHGW